MYSVNQVNQLYVVTNTKLQSQGADQNLVTSDAVGTLVHKHAKDGWFQYFQYQGFNKEKIATDRIKKCKVKWVTYTPAAAMQKKRRTWTITIPGTVAAGKDYIVMFLFHNYFGMSDEDTYEKYAAARGLSGTNNKNELLGKLAISLAKNMSREIDLPFDIQVTIAATNSATSGTATTVTPTTKMSDIYDPDNSTAANKKFPVNILLTERVQPWEVGRYKLVRPEFVVRFKDVDGDINWGAVAEGTTDTNPILNGRETADLEWFCMGERGDQYRGKDWPLSITTPANLLVNPDAAYDYVVVHFWDDIDNEGPQKSERDMTFVGNAATSGLPAKMIALAAAIAGDAGLDHYTKIAETSVGSGVYAPTSVAVGPVAGLESRVATLENNK